MISKDEVKHIAKLARLELSEKEVEKMQKDLSGILDYFALLKKVPKIKESVDFEKGLKAVREDSKKERDSGLVERITAELPDKKDEYIKVKNIL